MQVDDEVRQELKSAIVAEVPPSVLFNTTVVSEKDGEALLQIATSATRRSYIPRDGVEEPIADSVSDADDDGEAANPEPSDHDFEMSLCHEEAVVSETDRLQFAAACVLDRTGDRSRDYDNMDLVEQHDYLDANCDSHNDTEADRRALEHARRLVVTYDKSQPVSSLDFKWFMLLMPDMFPNATGGPPKGVSEERWLRHLILRDGSPFQSAAFICAAGDCLMRRGVNLAAYLQFKASPARFSNATQGTADDIKRFAQLTAKGRKPLPTDTAAVKDLCSQVCINHLQLCVPFR